MTNYYFIDMHGQKQGPINDALLRQLVATRLILPETLMETDDGHQGTAGQIPGLFDGVTLSAPPPQSVYQSQQHATAPKKSSALPWVIGCTAGCFILLVIAVAIAVALLVPLFQVSIQPAREAARRMQCSNNMKQIGIALLSYHDTYGAFPPLYTTDEDGNPLHSWRVLILPFMEQGFLYNQIRLDEPWDSEYNSQFHYRIISCYHCPTNGLISEANNCNFAVIGGEVFVPANEGKRSVADIHDGTSNTIAVIEVREPFCWMDPTADLTLDDLSQGINAGGRIGSSHPGGCNVGLFDGSVNFVSDTVDRGILRAMGTKSGGEAVAFP